MQLSSQQEIRILHVDDDPAFTDLTGTFLQREDDRFAIETATSADEGMEKLCDSPPDCVVSDYNMPGMDGLEFLQTIREDNPDLPFILFTGKGSEAVASEAIAADVTDYLQKGSGSEQYELLSNRIRNAVEARRRAERAERQEQLMRLTEFAGVTGGFELDMESDTVLLTAGTRRIIGNPDTFEISLQEAIELFHPDDREGIQQTLDRALETGEGLHDRWRLQPGDGDQRLLDITVTPVVENGEVTKLRGAGNDITDRRERQRDLEQTETLFEHAQDSLFLIDVGEEFTIERANPAWEDATGLSAERVQDQTPRDVLGEQAGATAEAKYHECIQRQEPLQYEETARFDGERTHWKTRIAPVVVDGSVEYIAGSTRDVTEKKERQQELRQSERRLNALFEHSTDQISILDPEGRFEFVSPSIEPAFGHGPAELSGESAFEYIHPDDRADTRATFEQILSDPDRIYSAEYRYRDDEGSWRWVESRGMNRLDEPAIEGIIINSREITDRKKREQELRELKSQYETLAESFPNGAVFLINAELEHVRAGGRELSKIGLSPHDIEGKKPHAMFTEEVADETCHYYEEALDGNGNTFEQEHWGERYRIQTVPVRTDDGEVNHAMAVSQNITEEADDRRRLERQNERLEEFAGIVSHDLRNPLGVAEGHLELAQDSHEGEHISKASNAIERCQALIEDLLTLAREGDQVDETDAVVVADVAEKCWRTVETAAASLSVEAPQTIEADQSRLQQLFENLYRNAVEHGSDGVTVSVGEMDNGFTVADTGPGIPESEREEVFEAGYSTNEDGTGFGLRIVEQIADAHGWEVTVTESEQGGARFEITGVEKAE